MGNFLLAIICGIFLTACTVAQPEPTATLSYTNTPVPPTVTYTPIPADTNTPTPTQTEKVGNVDLNPLAGFLSQGSKSGEPVETDSVDPTSEVADTPIPTETEAPKELGGGEMMGYWFDIAYDTYGWLNEMPDEVKQAIGPLEPTSAEELASIPHMKTLNGVPVPWDGYFTVNQAVALVAKLDGVYTIDHPNSALGGHIHFAVFEVIRPKGSFFIVSVVKASDYDTNKNFSAGSMIGGADMTWFEGDRRMSNIDWGENDLHWLDGNAYAEKLSPHAGDQVLLWFNTLKRIENRQFVDHLLTDNPDPLTSISQTAVPVVFYPSSDTPSPEPSSTTTFMDTPKETNTLIPTQTEENENVDLNPLAEFLSQGSKSGEPAETDSVGQTDEVVDTPIPTETEESDQLGGGEMMGYMFNTSFGQGRLNELPDVVKEAIGPLEPTSQEELMATPQLIASNGENIPWDGSFITTTGKSVVLVARLDGVSTIPNPNTDHGGFRHYAVFEIFRQGGSFFIISEINDTQYDSGSRFHILKMGEGFELSWFEPGSHVDMKSDLSRGNPQQFSYSPLLFARELKKHSGEQVVLLFNSLNIIPNSDFVFHVASDNPPPTTSLSRAPIPVVLLP